MNTLLEYARNLELNSWRFPLICMGLVASVISACAIGWGESVRAVFLMAAVGGFILATERPFEWLLLFLALMPFEQIKGGFGTLPRLVGLPLIAPLVLTYLRQRRLDWKLKDWLLVVWLTVVWLSVSLATDRNDAITVAFSLTQLFVLYLAFGAFVDSIGRLQKALSVLAGSAMISVLMPLITQIVGVEANWIPTRWQSFGSGIAGYRYGGGYGESNEFAAFLLLPLLFSSFSLTRASKWQHRLAWLAAATILATGFFLTLSRSGLVGLLVMFGFLLAFRKGQDGPNGKRQSIWRTMIILVITALLLLFFSGSLDLYLARITKGRPGALDDSAIYRIESVNIGLKIFATNPLLGIGVRQFREVKGDYGFYIPGSIGPAHNMYIEILTGLGLLGFLPFTAVLVLNRYELKKGLHNVDRLSSTLYHISMVLLAAYTGFLVTAWFTNTETKKMLWVLLACGTVVSNLTDLTASRARGISSTKYGRSEVAAARPYQEVSQV